MKKEKIKKEKRRSSIFSIIIIVAIIAIAAVFTIKYIEDKQNNKELEPEPYISNLDEVDMMVEEYSKINTELRGIYAFAIYENNIVAIKDRENIINLVQINPEKEYEYLYNDTKLYFVEKDTGIVSIVPLNAEQYAVESTMNLECKVDSFEVYNNEIFYISEGKLYKYNGETKEEWSSNVTSKNFVIKKGELFFVKDNNLVKQDMEKKETVLAQSVNEVYYYNYYERNKIVYDVQYDTENVFKSIYNFYTGEIFNSIKNNTTFIPFKSSEYVYLTNDRKNIMKISGTGSSKYLLKAEVEIEDIVFLKDGSLIVKKSDGNVIVKINSGNEERVDNIKYFHNIRYLK